MPIQVADPFGAFLSGRQARQDERYGQTRNALAQMELEQAPVEMARRNRIGDLQIQGLERQYSQDQVTEALKQTAAAAMRLSQSSNPRAEAQVHGEFLANLRKQNPEIDQYDDEQFRQYMDWVAGEAQAKLGIAPTPKLETLQTDHGGLLQRDPTTGALKQIVAPQKPETGFTLGAGDTRYGADGKPIASRPPAPTKATQPNWTRVEQTLPDGKVQVGFVDTNSPNPEATFRPLGSPSNTAKDPKITEGERVAANYLLRMESAEKGIGGFKPSTKDYMLYNKALNSGDVVAFLANSNMSPEGQRFFQYVTDWSRAKLRKESGAVISPSEIIGEVRTYFPSAGDDQSMVKQKQNARKVALDGMRVMAGGAAKQVQQEAPSEAVSYLRQHPELKEQFKAKYGYLPDGL